MPGLSIASSDIRKLQRVELRIALQVIAICDAHQISYVLLAGTALGARRHGGFIPWDDDVDIGMLRSDYDRFLAIAAAELPDTLYLQEWREDPHMGAPYAKVRLNGTRMIEAWSEHVGGHKGIFVDIFPLDNMPDGRIRYWLHAKRLMFWIRAIQHQTGYSLKTHKGWRRIADVVVRAVSRKISPVAAKAYLHRLMTRYAGRTTRRVAAVGGSYGVVKETLERTWITNATTCEFEGETFRVSALNDAYLSHLYGDFMTPPPASERKNKHSLVELDFGEAVPAPHAAAKDNARAVSSPGALA